jgi:hypothetical protein
VIIIHPHQFKDIDKLGFLFSIFCLIIVIFQSIPLLIKLTILLLILLYGFYLYKRVKTNENLSILLNDESNWYLKDLENTQRVELKDYWILNKHIFIWLKGSNKSISLVLSRSIIGEQNFSLVRSKLK